MCNYDKKIGDNIVSGFYSGISNYYSDALSIEKIKVHRPVILPPISEEFIDYKILEAYSEIGAQFILADDAYTDVIANFYPPLITPMVEDGECVVMKHDAPEIADIFSNEEMVAENYDEINFIPLLIPKHIVMNFRREIPVGTEFIASFTGGTLSYGNIHILGVANIGKESAFDEWYLDEHRMMNWGDLVDAAGGEEEVFDFLASRIEERDEYIGGLQEKYHFSFEDAEGEVNQREGQEREEKE